MNKLTFPLILSLLLCISCRKTTSDNYFWSAENSPEKIGKLVTDNLLQRPDYMMYNSGNTLGIHYAEACTGFGITRFAALLGDTITLKRISDRYIKSISESLVNTANHVDVNVYGILPFELYKQTHEKVFLDEALYLANSQWDSLLPNGICSQARYWVDDIWMIVSLQVQAYRITGDTNYLERAALVTEIYLKKLQQPNGLFYHGEEAPFFWGRGNGWAAAGMAELLSELPENNVHYLAISEGYRMMMLSLLNYQTKEGMWRQLIDNENSWPETSSTAMFGYAITIGVKKGLLDEKVFTKAYQKAWLALAGYVNAEGKLADICVGTGKSKDKEYYLNRPKVTGDLHGQAPLVWFAFSLLNNY